MDFDFLHVFFLMNHRKIPQLELRAPPPKEIPQVSVWEDWLRLLVLLSQTFLRFKKSCNAMARLAIFTGQVFVFCPETSTFHTLRHT